MADASPIRQPIAHASCPARWFSLRNAEQFGAIMQQGRVVARSKHFVLHAACWPSVTAASHEAADFARPTRLFAASAATTVYLGTIVPKRWARRAVTRNLVKRQIRHVMQEHIPALPHSLAIVVRQRAAFDPSRFISAGSAALRAAVRQELMELAGATDWQAIAVLSQPPHKTRAPAERAILPDHRRGGVLASGTMLPAP